MLATALAAASLFTAADAEKLAFFAGCWRQDLADGAIEEQWLAPAGGALIGVSRTVRAGRMRAYEYMRIAEADGALSYIASPSGQATTAFKLVSVTANEAVFENPAHDFPKRIIYRRTPDGLTARVEAGARGEDYAYKPCR